MPDQQMDVVLIALHAGYFHSSLALRLLQAACVDEPFYRRIEVIEHQEKAEHFWLMEQVVTLRPRLIGISTYLWNIDAALRLAELFKGLLPQTEILLGGPEAGPRARELLENHAAIDFVIEGEGELAFVDLLRWRLLGLGGAERVAGLHYRHADGGLRANPPSPPDLRALPSPYLLGLMDLDKPLLYWETARGCPLRCSFCASAEERLRTFPEERIDAELQVIAGVAKATVKLLDRSFHLGRRRTLSLLQRFVETPEGIRFHLELNPDRISEEAMEVFRSASPGKFQFEIGLQTLDGWVLSNIERQMDVVAALANIRRLVQEGRHPVHLDLLVGLPGDSRASCRDALDRTFRLYPDHLQLGTLKLLPGTPLRREAQALGYLWDRKAPYEVLRHPGLDFTELASFKRYAELLERLWNSGLLRATLVRMVDSLYQSSICRVFDDLLERVGDEAATARPGPERLFTLVVEGWREAFEQDPTLVALLLWDYCHHFEPGARSHPLIRAALPDRERMETGEGVRRLPVVELGEEAVGVINRIHLSGEAPLAAGRYAIWAKRHLKGRPVEVFPVTTTAVNGSHVA